MMLVLAPPCELILQIVCTIHACFRARLVSALLGTNQ